MKIDPATFSPGTATVGDSKRPPLDGIARLAATAPHKLGLAGRWVVTMLGYHPPTINMLIGRGWRTIHSIKRRDRKRIGDEMALAGIPRATGKRRVTLEIILAPRQRSPDPDAFWKVLLDSLVSCGALKDDNRQWVELAPVEIGRGKRRATVLTLEDVPCG